MTTQLADATGQVIKILDSLSSEDRHRVVQAALLLLGEAAPSKASAAAAVDENKGEALALLSTPAKAWMQKHGLTTDTLGAYMHLEKGHVAVIEIPGNHSTKKDKTKVCYLMAGILSFVNTGIPEFTDNDARALCSHFGCYDLANHAVAIKGLGNKVVGSKASGWRLTVPGLDSVAELVKAKV